ncbi:MAG: DNA repair protein RecO [Alphaproteobacteria bacterium]|nr:DNA repair protein RecO [Alphaproteobacteria bacterium]
MTHITTPAIICAIRHHGEHGVIARLMTPEHGLMAGYVRGGRSTRLRPVLMSANLVQAEFRARTGEQLASLTVELEHSRGPLLSEPLPAAAIEWCCALTAAGLPEEQSYPALYEALDGVLGAIEAAPAARGWAVALVRYELLMLTELGFGLDLNRCAVTGENVALCYVSPKSGAGVSADASRGYEQQLLRLPGFLTMGGMAEWTDILDGLALTGHFLERSVLTERRAEVLAARGRLVERLKRAVA